jgi:hypothetical protein
MSETPTIGRPRAELTKDEFTELARLAELLAGYEAEAQRVRTELVAKARAAEKRGASRRAIGEAVGLTKEGARHLLGSGK